LGDSDALVARVYESVDKPHFDESRENRAVESPSGAGTRFINFEIDAEGHPIAFQFRPSAGIGVFPIANGRVEPF